MPDTPIKAVLFDFGGVLAEEGFRKGLFHIASLNALDPQDFFTITQGLIFTSGYLTGKCTEGLFWGRLKASTGIRGTDEELREIILSRFILRDWMMDIVKRLNSDSIRTAILSDQTNWLDELDIRLHFSGLFERIFNSYHLGKSKNDAGLFTDVLSVMCLMPGEALFIDDTPGHVERARSKGLRAIHYTDMDRFLYEMREILPGVLQDI